MNTKNRLRFLVWAGLLSALCAEAAPAKEEALPDSPMLMQALVDEMDRSMDLQMEDLEKPYFIQYIVDDSLNYFLSAEYGAITGTERDRSRRFYNQVRVGSYELDNTNFSSGRGGFGRMFGGGGRRRGGGGGGRNSLPLDDDYTAIRQAIWWATDWTYKDSVETLTQKKAYMKDKRLEDRPHDFTRASAVEHMEPTAKLSFDQQAWEQNLKKISGQFKNYKKVQDSGVELVIGAGNKYLVNTEGTRLRTGRGGVMLTIRGTVQAADGMLISDQHSFYAGSPDELPPVDRILAKVDELAGNLIAAMDAPVLESYSGPVLFEGMASAQLFKEMLAEDIAGQVEPVGSQRSRGGSGGQLEKKLGSSIFPETFNVYDDPTIKKIGDIELLGNYEYDDEGTPAQRVNLVEEGELKNMVLSRIPTKKLSGSNGHARRAAGSGRISAAIGALIVEDTAGISDEELKAALIEAARDQDLEYGLCVRKIRSGGIPSNPRDMMSFFMSMQRGGGGNSRGPGDPILIYKVYVEDGLEELVRGCEFDEIKTKDLKNIIASGKEPTVYNYVDMGIGGSTPPTSVAAPAVLFEELDLNPIEQEHDKRPILISPLAR
ncbi:MAG: hypothetical protein KJ645_14185 [Planctomycetes bacterium]|nr:hypothetical protein [Planctomycetota bacterium]